MQKEAKRHMKHSKKNSKRYIIGVSLKERKENGTEAILGEIKAKNFLKLMKQKPHI